MTDKNTDEQYKSAIISLVVFAIGIGLAWGALFLYCHIKSETVCSYTFTGSEIAQEQDGLSVSMEIAKSWKDISYHYEIPFGAQYDFMVVNNSANPFDGFSVVIETTEDMVIDSGWNGTYEAEGNKVIFTAEEPMDLIVSGEEKPFGAVMYSKNEPEIESYVLSGYWTVNAKDTGVFWILVELSGIFLAYLVFRYISIIRQRKYEEQLKKDDEIIVQSLKTLTEFIDAKDAYTKDHSVRVARYAEEIARRYGLPDEEIRHLYYITLLHDCGKISIPDEILKKKGSLTPEEFAVIKTHTTRGNELLKKFTALPGIGDGAHYHHERYDGYGYPSGLEGEEIPLYARIICVADAYDAMSSNRCYRNALDKEKILSELDKNKGKQFDPQFVTLMEAMIEDGFVEKVKEEYPVK